MSYPSKKAQRLPRRGRGGPRHAPMLRKKPKRPNSQAVWSEATSIMPIGSQARPAWRAEPPASGAVKSFGGESRKRFGAKRQNERAEIDRANTQACQLF